MLQISNNEKRYNLINRHKGEANIKMTTLKKLLFVVLVLMTICKAKESQLEHVSVQLAWKHQFEFAGFYAAKEKGFYKEAGLDVQIKEFTLSSDTVEEVLNGTSTYGLFSSQLILRRLSGKKVILLASYFKQNALVLIAQPEIKSIADLKNKRLMLTKNELLNTSLGTMLHNHHLREEDIRFVTPTFNTEAFEKGEVDAISAFVSNEVFILDQKNIPYTVLSPADEGIYSYDLELFTSEQEAFSHPLRTKKFIEATKKGWEYALSHKQEIIDLIYAKYSQKKSKEALRYEADSTEKLIKQNLYQIGAIVPELLELNTNMYVKLGLIAPHWDLKGFIFDSKFGQIDLTPEEKKFIEEHPEIILGTEEEWKPYVIVNMDGSVDGYDVDVLKLINDVSGANFTLQTGKWQEMQEKVKRKEIDGLSSGSVQDERRTFVNFSDPYISMSKALIVSKENPQDIRSLHDLQGKTIAIHQSNMFDEKIVRQFKSSKIMRLESIKAVIEAVVTGKADAMIGNGATFYLANEMGLPYLKRIDILEEKLDLVFSVRKDWPEAISIINKSLAYIGENQLIQLQDKWFGQDKATILDLKYREVMLTDREKKYLKEKKQINLCIDPDWMPLEKMNGNSHLGISKEYTDIIRSKIDIPIIPVATDTWTESLEFSKARKCDILSSAMETPSRKEYLNFTSPYLEFPLVIATTNDKLFIADPKELNGKKISIIKGYAFKELLQQKYPGIEFVEVPNIKQGLQDVIFGKTFGYIDNLLTIGYEIQNNFSDALKITGKIDGKWELRYGVRNDDPVLLNILNKTIESIDEKTKQQIINQWIAVKYEQTPDHKLLWKVSAFLISIIALLLVGYYFSKRHNKKMETLVAQKVEEARKKDETLIMQSRMAAMGEMISLIAHQWKQPLSAINSIVMNIELKMLNKSYHPDQTADSKQFVEFLKNKHQSIKELTLFLSTTVDDFRNFFNPNTKTKEEVALNALIENALSILEPAFHNDRINTIKNFEHDPTLFLYKNEVLHVILNILKNSQDNFIEKQHPAPQITIRTFANGQSNIIRICDNGGGIRENILTKIFDPYFSTKDNKNGTGLGLYMSKVIIEEHHQGILKVYNTTDGVCFEIIFSRQ